MYLDPQEYKKAKNRSRASIAIDANGTVGDAVIVTINYYDRESGTTDAVLYPTSLAAVQEIRKNTNQELNRLDLLITDIKAVLGVA